MKKKNTTIDDLARMVNKGFEETAKSKEVNARFDKVDIRLDNLEQGQEEIKPRQDNAAYRFEVEDLKKRVKKLEFKAGIRRT